MQNTNTLTLDAIKNLAKLWNYQDAQWVFPLLKQKIEWEGIKTHVHVCRLGINEDSQSVSDLLIYIDGFGGVTCEVPTKAFYKDTKRLKVVVAVQGDTMKIDFNPTKKEIEVSLVWDNNQWGYHDLNKIFIPVTTLPEGPIKLEYNKGSHTETVSVNDFIHPSVIAWRPEGMEHALNIFSEDFSHNECLHDSWEYITLNELARKHIYSIIESAPNIKQANTDFYAWWNSPERKKMLED